MTRRWLLALAGGGFIAGVATRQAVNGWATPADGAADQMAGLAPHRVVPALPMEEEPLPHDVHLPPARLTPASLEQGEFDPLIGWAPQPVAPAVSAAAVPAPAAPRAMAKAAPAAPAPPSRSPAAPTGPAWLRNARPYIDTKSVPAIAIVIDDLGLSAAHTREAIGLPGNVTLAFMTYAPGLEEWTGAARAGRHELLVHVPMQPLNGKIDPGPQALTVALSDAEILERLRWGLGRLEGYVGINNHMGSRFTQDRPGMSVVLEEVKARGLLFLDSVTIGGTVGAATAEALRVPAAERNVFLDDVATVPGVSRQIAVLEQVARRHGSAIAIGHPHPATLAVLRDWLPGAASRGVA
ncbi:MAG TPA: divergent polysaccharide deacetylase family protein, partial [Stellaceae bacterium]|nr:divergent polysaccharide deacetylase family protein [Stellaceae bacterium]